MFRLFFCLLLYIPFLQSTIIEVAHFHDLLPHIEQDTLVVLDIDDTLLIPVQMLGCDEWFLRRLQEVEFERALADWEAIRQLTKMEIVEPGSAELVADLQNRKVPVMGLTTQGLALATCTNRQLMELGVNLSLTAPSKQDHFLLINRHGILYRNGILFTSGTHKGKALFSLLDQLHYYPKKILFLNDKLTHLKSVEETAEERGVKYIGLRYAYSDVRKTSFDPAVANYQFNHSRFTHILGDEEARNLLSPVLN